MKYDIRELTLGEILDQAIALMKDNVGTFLAIMCVLWLPIQLANTVAALVLLPEISFPPDPDQLRAFLVAAEKHGNLFNALNILALISAPLFNAAIVYAVANKYLGKPASAGSAIGNSFRHFFPLLWTWFLLGIAIMGGLILLVIPGIIAIFWFALATQVVVIENVNGFAALKRSREIMAGNAGTLFVLILVMAVLGGGVGIGGAMIPERHVQAIFGLVVQMVVAILSSAAGVVFYFSCRCKNEQFDLDLLASDFDGGGPADDPDYDEIFTPEG